MFEHDSQRIAVRHRAGASAVRGASIQRKADAPGLHSVEALSVGVEPVVAPKSSAGRPLPDALKKRMERGSGEDLSNVRVVEDAHAPQVGALAYTRGERIHVAPGHYQPNSSAGQSLLGHEVGHVPQQRRRTLASDPGNKPE